jgi:magnesium-transporting ATPase (P-type)
MMAQMSFDLWFLFGMLIYVVIFLSTYLYSKKNSIKKTARDPEDKDKILRWTIASLIFSAFLLIIKPIWFPSSEVLQYDFYDILLLITALVSIMVTFILIKRNK